MARKLQLDVSIASGMKAAADDSFKDNIKMIDIEKESYQEYKNRVVHPDCFRSLTKEINVTAKKKKAAKTETKTKTKPKIDLMLRVDKSMNER